MDDEEICFICLVTSLLKVEVMVISMGKSGTEKFTFQVDVINVMQQLVIGKEDQKFEL